MSASLRDLAQLVQGTVVGDDSVLVAGVSPIDTIMAGTLVFAEGEENIKKAERSEAAAILVTQDTCVSNKPTLQVANGFKAFVALLEHFFPKKRPTPSIHATAIIGENVQIGQDVYIGPYVVLEDGSSIGDRCILKGHIHIGQNVVLGSDSTLHSHVSVYDNCVIGSHVTVHASTVIGSDGFGYTFVEGAHLKVPHVGNVVVEDCVEIGANSAIDRATMGSTVIGTGTKIDNFVQIAHSVQLGQHNILCAFTGIAGSTTSGNHVIFAANVGVSDHVRIEDEVILGARTGVPPKKLLKKGLVHLGNPARPREHALKHELAMTRIPFMQKKLKALSEQMATVSKQLDTQEMD